MDKNKIKTLQDLVRESATEFGDKIFIREKNGKEISEKSFRNLYDDTCRLVGYITLKYDGVIHTAVIGGSGYAWLVLENGNLKILTTANQNTPDLLKQYPVLNLDVWEHAYYLKYYNLRADYIDNWFSLIDWKRVQTRLLSSNQTGKLLLH